MALHKGTVKNISDKGEGVPALQYIVASSTGLINCHLEQGSGDLAASGREAMKNILETQTWIVHLFLGIILGAVFFLWMKNRLEAQTPIIYSFVTYYLLQCDYLPFFSSISLVSPTCRLLETAQDK